MPMMGCPMPPRDPKVEARRAAENTDFYKDRGDLENETSERLIFALKSFNSTASDECRYQYKSYGGLLDSLFDTRKTASQGMIWKSGKGTYRWDIVQRTFNIDVIDFRNVEDRVTFERQFLEKLPEFEVELPSMG